MDTRNALPAIHPGEILRKDVLPSTDLTVTGTAKALGVSRQMIHDILAERRPLSPLMCLKIARLFGGSPELWMRLQVSYDLKTIEKNKRVMRAVERIIPVREHRAA